jgi:hypothetical protein
LGQALSLTLYAPVVRDIIFVAFFIGIFAAIGMDGLFSLANPESRLPLLVFVALLLDAASTSVQPLARSDKQHFIAAGEYLASVAPNERVIVILSRVADEPCGFRALLGRQARRPQVHQQNVIQINLTRKKSGRHLTSRSAMVLCLGSTARHMAGNAEVSFRRTSLNLCVSHL